MVKTTAPLFLSSQVTLNPGGSAIASTFDLTSPFRTPILIDAITWFLSCNDPAAGGSALFGAPVQTRLSLGRTELTRTRVNGFVPIWSLASQVNQGLANSTFQVVRTAMDMSEIESFTGITVSMNYFKWKLPRPLYVPPGMSLQSEFFRVDDGVTTEPVSVNVGYAGRYVDPTEPTRKKAAIPFCTAFTVPAASTSYISDAQDLINPFKVPLHVQRFTGRAYQAFPGPFGESAEVPLTSQMQIQDSHGHNIVRDFIPNSGPVVIDYLRRGWTFNTILDPKQWYVFKLLPAAGPTGTFGFDQQIAMIGWREEEFA